jgi:diguanylate cyclase (GGDEF)-like protein
VSRVSRIDGVPDRMSPERHRRMAASVSEPIPKPKPKPMSSIDPIAVLLSLTERLSEDATLEESLSAVSDSALLLLPADHASIRIVDADGDELLACARSGRGVGHDSLPLRKGEGIAGWVLANARPALVSDTREDPRFLAADRQGFAIASIVAAPLVRAGRAMGVLSASSSVPGAFVASHERLARLLASCSVPALERARLERLAVTDDLTSAFNGRYLLPRLQDELRRARSNVQALSVAMLDLDHFKRVNDTFGHARGDAVLRAFADRVRDKTRRSDVLIRRGGEEFVLILPATDREQAIVLAERIRRGVGGAPFAGEGAAIRQTVSLGVATWDGVENADDLLHRSDVALYNAKSAGRDRVA